VDDPAAPREPTKLEVVSDACAGHVLEREWIGRPRILSENDAPDVAERQPRSVDTANRVRQHPARADAHNMEYCHEPPQ